MNNLQRDGHMRMTHADRSRRLRAEQPRPDGAARKHGARLHELPGSGSRRQDADSARELRRSLLASAAVLQLDDRAGAAAYRRGFAFELGKCEVLAVRRRMLGRLALVDKALSDHVAEALGMPGQAEKLKPAVPARDLPPSPALSQYLKAPQSIAGRKLAVLVTDGVDDKLVAGLKRAAKAEGALVAVVAPKVGGFTTAGGEEVPADFALTAAPSVLFDAVVVAPSEAGVAAVAEDGRRRRLGSRRLRALESHRLHAGRRAALGRRRRATGDR